MVHATEQNMPIYEYQCEGCGHVMEVIIGGPPSQCERCGRPAPPRILSAHRVSSAGHQGEETLCCGRTARPAECVPGSCCGHAGAGHD
jgi:putative FmdB family regulatory protein